MRVHHSLAALAITGAAALTAAALTPGTAAGSTDPAQRHVAELRQILTPYEDVQRALGDGFVATDHCVQSANGGMGYHYANPQRLRQPLDPDRPAILLYVPDKDGTLQLGGAEFFHPDADQNLATDDDRPSLWGVPFQGPMPGHEPGMPIHYDLHVWTNVANPDGAFSPWNPRVQC